MSSSVHVDNNNNSNNNNNNKNIGQDPTQGVDDDMTLTVENKQSINFTVTRKKFV